MPSQVSLKQLQSGPKLTLNFTVSCSFPDADNKASDALTDPINVNNLALVRFKFRYAMEKGAYHLISTISAKKLEIDKYSNIQINVTCDKVEKKCICPNEWTGQTGLSSKKRDYETDNLIKTSLQVIIIVQKINCVLLQSLKLYEDDEFTDFQLHGTDGTIAVHKSVLAIHSDVFKTMLKGKDWNETKQNSIELADVSLQTLQSLKAYMYLGTLPDEGLEELILLATLYMMDSLKTDCFQKLVKDVTPEKVDCLIDFACENNMPDLVKALIHQLQCSDEE